MPAFQPLSRAQYAAIIRTGTLPGYTSPMDTDANYASLIAVTEVDNMDPRWPLAFTWSEGHMGSDPGLVAARVNNLGGVKWVGQAGAYDSGIPADTGGTYAGFPDLTGYWNEFVRIMHNGIIGPDYAAGNLIGVVEHWTNGPGTGHNKVDQYNAYVRDYPSQGATNVVTTADVLAEALKWDGCTDRGLYDPSNGHGTPFMWCEAFIESMAEHAGVQRVRYASALAFLNDPAIPTHPLPAPAGTCVLYGSNFDPSGHVAISLGDGRIIGTTVNGIAITDMFAGAAGWQLYPGATLANAPPPPIPDTFFIDGNKYGHIPIPLWSWSRWDALNTMGVPLSHPGEVNPNGLAMVTLGYATAPEVVLATGRRIQRYERGVLATSNGSAPWDVVTLLLSEI